MILLDYATKHNLVVAFAMDPKGNHGLALARVRDEDETRGLCVMIDQPSNEVLTDCSISVIGIFIDVPFPLDVEDADGEVLVGRVVDLLKEFDSKQA